MTSGLKIEEPLQEIGEQLRRQPSVRDAVVDRISRIPPSRLNSPSGGRRFSGPARVAALAASAIIVFSLWAFFDGKGPLGATEAFAAAIRDVERAQTFSARTISRSLDEAGNERVLEMVLAFRSPNLERIEYLKGFDKPSVSIRDYAAKQAILLMPTDKTAVRQDLKHRYSVDTKTGQTQPLALETPARDQVLQLAVGTAKEVGVEKVDGREVRVLRSDDGKEPTRTVWVDRATGKPVKIEIAWPSTRSSFTYDSIRIDEPLDDALFSLDPPAGYRLVDREGATEADADKAQATNGQMLAKLKALMLECHSYAAKNQGRFPERLDDLLKAGMKPAVLKALLAPPGEPGGEPVIEYRQPRAKKDMASEIVAYEKPAFRRQGQVAVGFGDGRAEILTDAEFEKQMR